ncbi:hypothetical protein [Mucilaginibacter mallensis]|uniref:hypothetical protein n=1 Tax=Mucilaginibacter mallensis TaxID=652787 RepID=UPI000B83A288|nr:hypothetical protein [Mucilaginibacter mallensis]
MDLINHEALSRCIRDAVRAELQVEGMFKKKAEIIPGFLNKLSSIGARYINKSLIERITAGLYKK